MLASDETAFREGVLAGGGSAQVCPLSAPGADVWGLPGTGRLPVPSRRSQGCTWAPTDAPMSTQ